MKSSKQLAQDVRQQSKSGDKAARAKAVAAYNAATLEKKLRKKSGRMFG